MWPLTRTTTIPIRVRTVDMEIDFLLASVATGQQLFDQATKSVGIREVWFFGLQYTDGKGVDTWLEVNEKVMSQDVPKLKYDEERPLVFTLKVKYYPEDVSEEIIQELTLRHFFIQIREAIKNDDIYCPPATSLLLAAYAAQTHFGDLTEGLVPLIPVDSLLPARVLQQQTLTVEEWRLKIAHWWKDLAGTPTEDSMREYLKLAQDLDMYGVEYFAVTNKRGTSLYLGIDAHGLAVYSADDKLTAKTGFPWSEIRTVSYDGTRFCIKSVDKRAPPFVCYVERHKAARRMLSLASRNHAFFVSRRKEDTAEIANLKVQAEADRQARRRERERLAAEVAARQGEEKARRQLEQQMKCLQEEVARREVGLAVAQETIQALEEQLTAVKCAKEALEEQADELARLNGQLAEGARLEASERSRLQEEVTRKQGEYERALEELQAKDEETQRLRGLVTGEPPKKGPAEIADQIIGQGEEDSYEEEMMNGSTETLPTKSREVTFGEVIYASSGEDEASVQDEEPQQVTPPSPQAVNSKVTPNLQEMLKKASQDLALTADSSKETATDALHRANVAQGRDKYRTLRDIRKGNTLRRVDYFESM